MSEPLITGISKVYEKESAIFLGGYCVRTFVLFFLGYSQLYLGGVRV